MTDAETITALKSISTATISLILLKKGIRRSFMTGPKPLGRHERIAGPAYTFRFVPAREDLATPESWGAPNSIRAAIEDMPEGVIAVTDARGVVEAGIFGDILALRMRLRGCAGLVTDGAVRDADGVRATDLPVWCAGAAAPASIAGHTFVGWNQPIGCGGAAVFPGDMIVADGDGAVVIPPGHVEEVVRLGLEQEMFEAWVQDEVRRGVALPGLYPANDETRARYAKWLKERG